MPKTKIGIDETEFTLSSGSPFEFMGVHSGKSSSGIELNVTAYSDVEAQQIEKLLGKEVVLVQDPFSDREYEATLNRRSSGYQEGRPEKWYHFEVKELDEATRFGQLELEGNSFHVLKNTETMHKDVIGIHILLRLSPEEFLKVQRLLELDSVKIRRLGIDEIPLVCRLGGALYWSVHGEGSQKYYKQIVRFFPIDDLPGKAAISLGRGKAAQSGMILALSARYEALVKRLVENGQISQQSGEELMSEEWESLIGDERRVMLQSQLTEVDDAEPELD